MPIFSPVGTSGIGLAQASGVPEITDAAILAALGRQLNQAVARQTVAASNLANLDTPGYRTQEVSFDDALDDQLGALARTSRQHLGQPEPDGEHMEDADGLASRRDGNNVQVDRELLALTRAAGDFGKAQTALTAKFRLVRYAINEGR
jgi:flagellar basal-body rod protein FlgB